MLWVGASAWLVKSRIIQLVFVASPPSTLHQEVLTNTGWLKIIIMC